MTRTASTKRDGSAWTEQEKSAVWWKGKAILGQPPAQVTADVLGSPIRYGDYGDTTKTTGWEIDHIVAVASGGSDDLSNLQPLQWRTNREKGDTPWFLFLVSRRRNLG